MKWSFVILFSLSFVLFSCSEDSICECIRASDKLLVKYDSLKGKTPSEKDEQDVKQLITEKKTKCKEFEQMAGPEMIERKASCKE